MLVPSTRRVLSSAFLLFATRASYFFLLALTFWVDAPLGLFEVLAGALWSSAFTVGSYRLDGLRYGLGYGLEDELGDGLGDELGNGLGDGLGDGIGLGLELYVALLHKCLLLLGCCSILIRELCALLSSRALVLLRHVEVCGNTSSGIG